MVLSTLQSIEYLKKLVLKQYGWLVRKVNTAQRMTMIMMMMVKVCVCVLYIIRTFEFYHCEVKHLRYGDGKLAHVLDS